MVLREVLLQLGVSQERGEGETGAPAAWEAFPAAEPLPTAGAAASSELNCSGRARIPASTWPLPASEHHLPFSRSSLDQHPLTPAPLHRTGRVGRMAKG